MVEHGHKAARLLHKTNVRDRRGARMHTPDRPHSSCSVLVIHTTYFCSTCITCCGVMPACWPRKEQPATAMKRYSTVVRSPLLSECGVRAPCMRSATSRPSAVPALGRSSGGTAGTSGAVLVRGSGCSCRLADPASAAGSGRLKEGSPCGVNNPSAALWVAGVAKGDGGTVGLLLASDDSSAAAPCALPLLSAGWPPFRRATRSMGTRGSLALQRTSFLRVTGGMNGYSTCNAHCAMRGGSTMQRRARRAG
mmetsp:Transcript_31675/g.81153  ORF Transcript_31675/g.81153 Transcript_31675/m.81153 type:complete len:251 (-) Transcript_31675:1345-2097(-)